MKIKILGIIIFILFIFGGGMCLKNKWTDNDLRMVEVSDRGIILRTMSWQRGMVNELEIEPQVLVWIPKGMGWYRSGDIQKLIVQEKKPELLKDILFYNFGFIPNLEGNIDWLNQVRYFFKKNEMMIKKETITNSLNKSTDLLNEILPRDFADSRMLREDIRVSVYNWGQSNGLAKFVATFLERSGVTVLGVDASDEGEDKKICQINYGPETQESFAGRTINENFKECEINNDGGLNNGEIELFFGDNYSSMLNYPSFINFKDE